MVKLYGPLIRHWCRQAGVRERDVDDVTQEIFATVSSRLTSFRSDHPDTTFRAWMRGVARLKLLEHFRCRGEIARGGTTARNMLQQVPARPDDLTLNESVSDLDGLYHRALRLVEHEFEERTWAAFWQVYVEGKTPTETAAHLGITPIAVRQAKSRVLRRIRQEIGELTA